MPKQWGCLSWKTKTKQKTRLVEGLVFWYCDNSCTPLVSALGRRTSAKLGPDVGRPSALCLVLCLLLCACSSVGRANDWYSLGPRFDPWHAHNKRSVVCTREQTNCFVCDRGRKAFRYAVTAESKSTRDGSRDILAHAPKSMLNNHFIATWSSFI